MLYENMVRRTLRQLKSKQSKISILSKGLSRPNQVSPTQTIMNIHLADRNLEMLAHMFERLINQQKACTLSNNQSTQERELDE